MALDKDLDDRIRQGIKDRDLKTVDVLRMLKTRLLERRTAKGFSGEVDDALVLEVIAAYRKQLQKALAEFEKLGERGAAQAAQLRFEIGVCDGYLPRAWATTSCASWSRSESAPSPSATPSRSAGSSET